MRHDAELPTLKDVLRLKRLKQTELAKAGGINIAVLNLIINGYRDPSEDNKAKIKRGLRILAERFDIKIDARNIRELASRGSN